MRRSIGSLAFVLAVGGLAAAACKAKHPTTAAKSRPPVQVAGPAENAVAPPARTSTKGDLQADVLSQDLATLNRKGYLGDAFFDFETAELREDARRALVADAGWLQKYPTIQIVLEGHCDERGTDDYNLALGDRRANAVKEYLASLGIAESRIRTVSFGKERPFCDQDTESCWQENRRAHSLVTAK